MNYWESERERLNRDDERMKKLFDDDNPYNKSALVNLLAINAGARARLEVWEMLEKMYEVKKNKSLWGRIRNKMPF